FDSTKFGTFQLVYCGTETLAGFQDAADSDIAGAASKALLTLTVPGSLDVGQRSYCAGVLVGADGDSDEDQRLIAYREVEADTGSAQEIALYGQPGQEISDIAASESIFIFIGFL